MTKFVVSTDKAPAAIGPYSQGIKANNFVFVSGQTPIDPAGGLIAEGIEAQTRQTLENIKIILASQGVGLEQVVKTTVFLKDMNDFATMNGVYASYFLAAPPARSTVQVVRLPKDVLVEIEAIAAV